MLIYGFLTQCNVAARHSNSEYLVKLIRHVADNPKFYSDLKIKVGLSKDRFTKLRVNHFSRFIQFATNIISNTRSYIMSTVGANESVPFLNVLHDAWDSKEYNIMGVSVQFVDFESGSVLTLAVGLQRSTSKKAQESADHIERMLFRYGITLNDVFRSVNDTATTAKCTGNLIAQGRNIAQYTAAQLREKNLEGGVTSCMLHSQELVLKHTLGLTTRSLVAAGGVYDSFPTGMALN